MDKDKKSLWMYLILLTSSMSSIFFLIGLSIGSNQDLLSSKILENASVAISAIATSFIAILTIVLAVETWRLRRSQDEQIESNRKEVIRPHIEIFLESSKVGFQFIILRVENVGRGLAKNIKFKIENPEKAFSDSEKGIIALLEKLSFFKNSLSTLGVGGTKKSFLFSFTELYSKYGEEFYQVRLEFQLNFEDIEGNSYSTHSVIDLSEFKGIIEISQDGSAHRLSSELKEIKRLMKSVITGNQRINIDNYSQFDRDKRQEMLEKRYLEHIESNPDE